MRIDLNHSLQIPESNPGSPSGTTTTAASSGAHALGEDVLSEDQAQLSGGHVQVDALAAQAAQLPEVRQEKVQALRQAVSAGQYDPAPEQVAGAMLDYMFAEVAA